MLIFIISIIMLILAYRFYSPFVEKQVGVDQDAATPSVRFEDGVDYVKVSPVKAFLIQFLNIAGGLAQSLDRYLVHCTGQLLWFGLF